MGRIERLCNFLTEEFSPVVIVLQYFAWLLTQGVARRCRLLYEGVEFVPWKASFPCLAMQLRRAVLLAAAWTEARHAVFFEAPWWVGRVVDTRLGIEFRRNLIYRFAEIHPCQLDSYFGRRLQASIELDPMMLLHASWQSCLTNWLRGVRISIASVEFFAQNEQVQGTPTNDVVPFLGIVHHRGAQGFCRNMPPIFRVGQTSLLSHTSSGRQRRSLPRG
jgi:hypothetical protein